MSKNVNERQTTGGGAGLGAGLARMGSIKSRLKMMPITKSTKLIKSGSGKRSGGMAATG